MNIGSVDRFRGNMDLVFKPDPDPISRKLRVRPKYPDPQPSFVTINAVLLLLLIWFLQNIPGLYVEKGLNKDEWLYGMVPGWKLDVELRFWQVSA